VLFSNAGNQGVVAPVTEYPEDVFDSLLAVHVRGAFLACKYGLPRMNTAGASSSPPASSGPWAPGSVAYVTAKHAQVGLMRTVAREAAPRAIRVNTLHPGRSTTPFSSGSSKASAGSPASTRPGCSTS